MYPRVSNSPRFSSRCSTLKDGSTGIFKTKKTHLFCTILDFSLNVWWWRIQYSFEPNLNQRSMDSRKHATTVHRSDQCGKQWKSFQALCSVILLGNASASCEIRTHDLQFTRLLLYPWANEATLPFMRKGIVKTFARFSKSCIDKL